MKFSCLISTRHTNTMKFLSHLCKKNSNSPGCLCFIYHTTIYPKKHCSECPQMMQFVPKYTGSAVLVKQLHSACLHNMKHSSIQLQKRERWKEHLLLCLIRGSMHSLAENKLYFMVNWSTIFLSCVLSHAH